MSNNNPDTNAVLDLNNISGSTIQGLALPRVSLSSTDAATPLSAHIAGMMVYNTVANGSGDKQVVEGIYYNNGSNWVLISSSAFLPWSLTGNSNTNSLNFIGTTDNTDFVTRTNNIERLRVTTTGKLLINTAVTPSGGSNAKLIINNGTVAGGLMIKDATEGLGLMNEGKVFTSDANGIGKWTAPSLYLSNVLPTMEPNPKIFPSTMTSSWAYTNNKITLPPGKWLLNVNFLVSPFSWMGTNETNWLRGIFSDSSTTIAPSADVLSSSPYVSGISTALSHDYNLLGDLIIQNTSNVNKDYYFCIGNMTNNNVSTTNYISGISSSSYSYIIIQKIN
ncbi:hypothetical protein HYN56_15305 [Flavobacterium crocinum]|uniref:Uncharacterized protein n=2 Tax=Flavobacterium crocinum TaxID=2183896 RepID=A0A2S1YN41_9FLAO|nr:hypothetical protein HYN56_15305 [Flavobacterium crocinum]